VFASRSGNGIQRVFSMREFFARTLMSSYWRLRLNGADRLVWFWMGVVGLRSVRRWFVLADGLNGDGTERALALCGN